ncbi:MAG TPA: HupE/UreJ family protein, partial [Vicinamibacterales bacterium]|nr:HupE/UreJ family protein [Vicinamibacterales bacterium]
MRRLRIGLFCVAVIVCAFATPAFAHPVPFSYLDLRLGSGGIDGTLVVHIFDAAHELNIDPPERLLDATTAMAQATALERLLAPRLHVSADGRSLSPEWSGVEVIPDRQSIRLHLKYRLDRSPGTVTVTAALFPYDPGHQTFLNIYERDTLASQSILDGGRPRFEYFAGTRQGTWAVIRKFVPAGIHHILIGPDHLLFLVGLLLLGGTIRQLAVVVTSFTVAHSITLSLAALNLVSPPARIIEPAIALSIVYVGA